ncbi:hypothetical protein AYI68_g856 [Smittium mucronatum]|uniref:Uncharacterized protein n=1 Tax=Smittium mucronatum TaxID=133383 RepID=A0A1R0H7A1_9FUNG|nr:hypothetical protein AYI68_g856 [Smittium mucronatum]
MRNHELVESGAYPYGFAPEVDAWRVVAEDRNSEALASISIEALELSGDLDPSVNLAGKPVMEDLVSSLLRLSLSSSTNPPVRFSPIIPTVGAVKTLSVVSTGSNGRSVDRWSKEAIPALRSLLAIQQQFRSKDLYQSNWYMESASDTI